MQQLIDTCIQDDDKLYLCVSSPTIKDKPVQIRPWKLSDADFVLDASLPLDPRKTVFVGGVPRPLKAGTSLRPCHRAGRAPTGVGLGPLISGRDCVGQVTWDRATRLMPGRVTALE